MAPTNAAIAGLLKQAVYYHLDNLSYQNAVFFAERLHAHDQRSPESAFLLALSHYRFGDSRSAYEVSKLPGCRGIHLGCSYIFAQSCLDLERYRDGITALEKARPLWAAKCSIGRHTTSARAPYPDASSASCLLGKLYRAYDDKKRAVPCFEDALRANPFMWDAFTILCDMGVNVLVPNIFRLNDTFARSFDQESGANSIDSSGGPPDPLQRKSGIQGVSQESDPFENHRSTAFQDVLSNNMLFVDPGENDSISRLTAGHSRYAVTKQGSDSMETPTGPIAVPDPQAPRIAYPSEPPLAPARRTRGTQASEPGFLDAPPKMSYRLTSKKRDRAQEQLVEPPEAPMRGSALSLAATERKRTASGHPVQPRPANFEEPRRSARLNVAPRTASRSNTNITTAGVPVTRELKKARPPISRIARPGSSGTSVGRVVSGNRKPLEDNSMDIDQIEVPRVKELPAVPAPPSKPLDPEPVKADEGLKCILDLLRKMASGYRLSSSFQCQEALTVFSTLPRSHQDTPWVLARMAKAHYELANYAEAEKIFRRLRMLAPTRHEDMEFYSTVLWQLRKGTELSFLAHELTDSAWDSPQAWCVLGNAFSLDCEHEQALQCFKRAIQLHPKFAYAYTLQGHEHVENEEYDKALVSYRRAIAADKRHYNAYYGIGKVYEKLGNYDKALSHYHAALVIHPTHAVLICCMGTVLQRQKQTVQALPWFIKAVELAPRAPEMRSKKAGALLAMGQLDEAKRELMILRDIAPNNAQVHFLLAKLAKTLGDKRTAVRHFTIALSLDPKANGEIKNEIGALEDDDGFDDSMMH
ncbi:TPR-like protein [Parathielavia appendiculata]|uniref:TPR-like protein n=1 Tax=Parathielavia appendiculata TaxID=2587402 RepID=A0AAN6TYT4_9PEZI|nr:TPR-like protein [Parathielavia appendiculata]